MNEPRRTGGKAATINDIARLAAARLAYGAAGALAFPNIAISDD